MNIHPSSKNLNKNHDFAHHRNADAGEASDLGFAAEPSALETIFQARVAAGARLNPWISPLLVQLAEHYHPKAKVFGFIHWINQAPDCPWIIISGNLEYGRKALEDDQMALSEAAIPIRWSIGRYQASRSKSLARAAYLEQLGISVLFDSEQTPVALQCHRISGPNTKCDLNPHAFSRTLETLYR